MTDDSGARSAKEAGPIEVAFAARAFRTPGELIERGAVGVRDGRIEYVGHRDGLAPGTRVVELDGVIVPGLVDAHAHVLMFGTERSRVDLRDASSPQDASARVRSAARSSGWVLGH